MRLKNPPATIYPPLPKPIAHIVRDIETARNVTLAHKEKESAQ